MTADHYKYRTRRQGDMEKQLLQHTDEQVRVDMDPTEAARLVRRLRKVTFFLRLEGKLITQRDEAAGTYRCYDVSESLRVSAKQAAGALEKWAHFNELKASRGEPTGKIEVCRLGDCLFIG